MSPLAGLRPPLLLTALSVLVLLGACEHGATGSYGDDDDDSSPLVVGDDDDSPNDDDDTGESGLPCNGHVELCARRFDQVALPATHNSMSNREDGWWVPNQNLPIVRQLEDGIRGLMLDTYYWNDDLYLCHSSCLLGSKHLVEALVEIREFLAGNPREVLVIIFQDGISAEDTAGAFEAADLGAYLHGQLEGQTWPTLGEMIDSGRRLVVGAESSGPPPSWYHHAWDLYFDTPYSFASVEDFSCELHRGQEGNPLFLVNHWLSTPLASESNAALANSWSVLHQRAIDCHQEQQQIANLLAVDFYDQGDLFQVVNALNGVGR
ncbi:MAG: hypothetical protein CMP23_15745 [Rickettsiales bacterium]|nr:hypothetical protein [Rickettsiales bacterium]